MNSEFEQKFREYDDKIKELRMFGEDLQRQNELLKKQVEDNKRKEAEPSRGITYDFLTVYRLTAGIPILTTTTNLKGFPSQIFLVNASGNTTPRKLLAVQIGNTVSSVALT